MNTNKRFLILFYLVLLVSAVIYAQSDSTMTAIQENTLLTAEHTAKDQYDYLAVVISVLAFIVGGITLHYSIKTFRSQKKTESNTTPVINRSIQYVLLKEQLVNVYDIYIYLFVLFFQLRKNEYKCMPSEHFWNDIQVRLEQFHESLFYSNMDEWKKFVFLKRAHERLANDLTLLRASIEDKNADSKNNEKEFAHILDDAGYVLWAYRPVFEDIYHKNFKDVLDQCYYDPKDSKIFGLYKAKYVPDAPIGESDLFKSIVETPGLEEIMAEDINNYVSFIPYFDTKSEDEIYAFVRDHIMTDIGIVLFFSGNEPATLKEKRTAIIFACSRDFKKQYTSRGFIDLDNLHSNEEHLKNLDRERWYFYFKKF